MAERGPFRDDPLVEEGKGLGHLLLRHVQQFRGVGGELQGTKVPVCVYFAMGINVFKVEGLPEKAGFPNFQ